MNFNSLYLTKLITNTPKFNIYIFIIIFDLLDFLLKNDV